VTPNATALLTDAFRKGFITADDVISRVGEHAKTKEKAQIALNKEVVSPENTAARAATVQANTSAAQLGNAQAQAALPLVEPQAQISSEQLRQQAAEQDYGPGSIKAFHDLAPLAPGFDGTVPKDEHGNTDYSAMAKEGANLQSQWALKQQATQRLQAVEHVDTKGGPGVGGRKDFNAFKEDVTPGSPLNVQYSQVLANPLQLKFMKPGTSTAAPQGAALVTPATTPSAGTYTPPTTTQYGDNAQAAADAAERAASGQPQPPLVTPAQPAAAAPKPVVQPSSLRPAQGSYDPNLGIITSSDTTATATELRKEMELHPNVSEFRKVLPQYQQLLQSEKELANPKFTPDRVFDLRLAFNYFKALHPDTRVTEQNFKELEKFTKITEDIPQDIKNKLMVFSHQQYMDPAARTSIIDQTRQAIQGQLNSAKATVQSFGKLAEEQGIPANQVVTPEWRDLFNTQIAGSGSSANAPQQGQPVTLGSGRKAVQDASGRWVMAP
jgi:hypothetical protein